MADGFQDEIEGKLVQSIPTVGSTMAMNVIEVQRLTRIFDGVVAVDHVSFEVEEGEIFGFLGPNGAGKTTTIKMITAVLRVTEGRVTVCGHDVVRRPTEVRKVVAVVPQENTADEDLTGYENLMLCSDLYEIPKSEGRKRAEELISLVELRDAAHRKVDTYSGGMRRRLELASGLVSRPQVLFLDEPTLGLDVQTRAAVWKYIRRLKTEYGMTLFLTTHYLEEADQLCDRLALIDHGRIVTSGTPANLKATLGGDILEITVDGASARLDESLLRIPGVKQVQRMDSAYRIRAIHVDEIAPMLFDTVKACGAQLKRVWLSRPSLDEAYLELTGHELRNEDAGGVVGQSSRGRRRG